MDLSNRIGEARKQIGIVADEVGSVDAMGQAVLERIDDQLEGVEEALEEAGL